jgi:AcrR family transcriptional regulator
MSDDILIFPTEDRPSRTDAVRNRRRLLETARTLLDEGALEDFTMSDIAKVAGVGKGTLYRHFPDKSALCYALLDEAMHAFQALTLRQMSAGDYPGDTLRWFLRETAAYVDRNIVLLREAAAQGSKMLLHPAHYWWRQTILGLLERLQFGGDAEYLADTLYIMTDVQTIRFQREMQHYSVERIQDGLVSLLDKFVPPR